MSHSVNASRIIQLIRGRREKFFEAQMLSNEDDPVIATQADLARAIADEYDDLLSEIEGTDE